MKKRHINHLEAHLEQLIEGAFAALFGRKIRAQDLALRLARAMDDHSRHLPGESRPQAPDRYTIYCHPDVQRYLSQQHPELTRTLSDHLMSLAQQSGLSLGSTPLVKLLADANLNTGDVKVGASHSDDAASSTAAMLPIELPSTARPQNVQLIINDERVIPLDADIINIGRHPENHIVIEDPTVSRHHLQLRLRDGAYILFEVRSDAGTEVNGGNTREHRLQTGDVVRIGNTQILYMQESDDHDDDDDQNTDAFDVI